MDCKNHAQAQITKNPDEHSAGFMHRPKIPIPRFFVTLSGSFLLELWGDQYIHLNTTELTFLRQWPTSFNISPFVSCSVHNLHPTPSPVKELLASPTKKQKTFILGIYPILNNALKINKGLGFRWTLASSQAAILYIVPD